MALIYKGIRGEFINNIPSTDLSDEQLKELIRDGIAALVCGREVSLAEFEGVLMARGLYTSAPKTTAKSSTSTVEKEV